MNVMIVDDEGPDANAHQVYSGERDPGRSLPLRPIGCAARPQTDGRPLPGSRRAGRTWCWCDMRMPGMDGLALCEALHKTYPQIRFIALSNYG